MILFGVLTGLASPRMEANLSTPWMGVWERACIGAYMLWVMVLAIVLLRSKMRSVLIERKMRKEASKNEPLFVLESDLHRLVI